MSGTTGGSGAAGGTGNADTGTTPAADAAEAAAWAALKEELESPEGEDAPAEDDKTKVAAEGDDDAPEMEAEGAEGEEDEGAESEEGGEEPDDSRLTPEQLRANNRNLNAALREARAAQKRDSEQLAGITQLIARLREGRSAEQSKGEAEQPKKGDPANQLMELPDIEENPVEYLRAFSHNMMVTLRQMQAGSQETRQRLEAKTQEDMFWGTVQRSEADILDTKSPNHKADYWDACKHLENGRRAELKALYPDKAPAVVDYARQQGFESAAQLREAILEMDRQAVARSAMAQGRSPALAYYETAVARGYQPGKAPAAREALKGGERGKAQITAMKKGVKASRTVSGGTGSSGADNELNVEDLVALAVEDPVAFDREWEKMERAARRG